MLPPNIIMTIAGSDSGAGAGIQADLKTIMALGGYGICAITALTAQNGVEVTGISAPDPDFVKLQIVTLRQGFGISAAKTGMLFSAGIIRAVSEALKGRDFPLVVDPVAISQSGCSLIDENIRDALAQYIIPGCDLLTPNVPEAEMLADIRITSHDDLLAAGATLLELGARAVLIKGGHLAGGSRLTDYLFLPGTEVVGMSQPRVATNNTHGTGCTLSAAIATSLGQGLSTRAAIARAQRYLNLALRESYAPGAGAGPVNHAANPEHQF